MYCAHCGKEISELVKFCPYCGAAAEQPAPVEEAPAAEPAVQEAPAAPVQEAPASGGKLRGLPRKWLVIGAVVLIFALAAAAAIGGAVASVASPQKQLLLAYAGAVSDVMEVTGRYYDDGLETMEKGAVLDASMELQVTELALTQALGMNPGVNSVKLDCEAITDKNGSLGVDLTLSSGKTELITLQAFLDAEAGNVVLAVPEVLSNPVLVDLGTAMEESVDYDAAPYVAQTLQDLDMSFLPEGEFLEELLPSLVKAALLEIDQVEKNKTEFTADGVTQKADCLTVTVTEVTLCNMANAVLEELKTDREIKRIITDFYKLNGELLQIPYDSADEFYEEFVAVLADAQEELRYYEGDEELCRLHTWVNGDNEILAIQLLAGDIQVFAAKAKDGSNVGLEFNVKEDYQSLFAIKGQGTEKNGKFSGTLKALVEYDEMVIVECTDVNTKKLEEGYLSGSFHVKLGDAAREEVGAMMSGLEIRLTMDQAEKKASGKVEVILQGTTLGTLTLDGSTKLKGEVKVPKDAVPLEEMGMPNLEIIFNRLKAAGLNDQLVDSLGQMLLMGALG